MYVIAWSILFQNELLPASDRLPPHTRKKPTGPYDRGHLLDHLKQQAAESNIGEDYIPFVKKPAKETQVLNLDICVCMCIQMITF